MHLTDLRAQTLFFQDENSDVLSSKDWRKADDCFSDVVLEAIRSKANEFISVWPPEEVCVRDERDLAYDLFIHFKYLSYLGPLGNCGVIYDGTLRILFQTEADFNRHEAIHEAWRARVGLK